MDEYIKRSALIAEFKRLGLGANSLVERIFADGVYTVIEAMPAADVVPVRHGRWKAIIWNYTPYMECSVCHAVTRSKFVKRWKFCPNCGAKMEGAE